MKAIITFLAIVLAAAILVFVPPLAKPFDSFYGNVTVNYCIAAIIVCVAASAISGFWIYRDRQHGSYLLKLFMFALFVRVIVGVAIFIFNGQDFFGGDAWTYDNQGNMLMLSWFGDKYAETFIRSISGGFSSGWGMVYVVAAIYTVVGRNMLAIQFFNAVLGAATAPIIFLCAREVFNNSRVAKVAAVAVAFYPSLVLWSSQGLKDGPIVFALALCVLATLKLGQKITPLWLGVLIVGLFGVLSLRFYVFYMILAAVGGAFVIGMRAITAQSMLRQFMIMVTLGLAMMYMGVTRTASVQFETYGSLEVVQRARLDSAQRGGSGFAADVDVSTPSGALQTIPIGMLYLMFAPFPWQVLSLRQSLTIPEMAIWWSSFPLLVLGVWYSLKYRLRQMSPIWIFTSMLTLAYSVFQGNVGTAYRQRSQLLVFYFIFVAVGLILLKEKQEAIRRRRADKAGVRFGPVPASIAPNIAPNIAIQRKSPGSTADTDFRPLRT